MIENRGSFATAFVSRTSADQGGERQMRDVCIVAANDVLTKGPFSIERHIC